MDSPHLAAYFNRMFDLDWSTSASSITDLRPLSMPMAPVAATGIDTVFPVRLTAADYEQV